MPLDATDKDKLMAIVYMCFKLWSYINQIYYKVHSYFDE